MADQQEAASGTSIMWFRRDLRLNDLPALAEAAASGRLIPCFVFDDRLITGGRFPSSARTGFMLGCLEELRRDLRELGSDLVLRRGRPEDLLPELAKEASAGSVHWTADLSPFAKSRDKAVDEALDGGCDTVEKVIVLKRTGQPVAMRKGRDLWWSDAVRGQAPHHAEALARGRRLRGRRSGRRLRW